MIEDQLAEHERRIVSAARTGELVDLRVGDTENDDPADGGNWDGTRTVRAELLIELLTADRVPETGRPRAIKVQGARITGRLDLEACTLICPLLLRGCHIEHPVNLNEATALAIRLPGCYIPGLSTEQLRTTGNLELNNVTAKGEVRLLGAHIGGQLDLTGAQLTNPNGPALVADGLTVDQSMFCSEGFTAEGEVSLLGAHISRQLDLTGAQLTNPEGDALAAYGLTVDQGMFCSEGFTAKGEFNLGGAHIGGRLDLTGAQLTNPKGPALAADGLTVDQDMFCPEGFTAEGEVRLGGAHIGGQLAFVGAQLTNPGGKALAADGLTVEQDMFCSEGFTAEGEVRLAGANIGGLDLTGAQLTNPGGKALAADGLTVDQGMFCSEGFTAEGEVWLLGAHIGGQLAFVGAQLTSPGGHALAADRLTVDQGMFCREGFTAEGEVRLLGAHIGGQLDLTGAHLTNPDGPALNADGLAVDQGMFCREGFAAEGEVRLPGAHIGGQLSLRGASLNNPKGVALELEAVRTAHLILRPAHRPKGIVDLTNAQVGSFYDDQVTWPVELRLRGFTYETLENDQISVRERLHWLTLHPGGYTPQIYDQLAAAYRRAGHVEKARKVGVAKQRRRRSVVSPLNWLLYLTVGYGYRTWLAAIWLAALAVLGSWVFTHAEAHQLMRAAPNAPPFHPVAYTLDVLVPVLDLGQRKVWTPYGWALYWSWTLVTAGWVLTTAVVAGLTGILKRD